MRSMDLSCSLTLVVCLAGLCDAAVRVVSPNGGESFPVGSTQLVVWQCDTSVSTAAVEFSYTDGVLWETLAAAAPCEKGQGSLVWKVPAVSSPRCLIRVTPASKSGGSDQSDAAFTVYPCTLRMDYDGDCVITFADYCAFAREWLACGDPYDPACGGNNPPVITSKPPSQAMMPKVFTYDVKVVDADGDALVYSLLRSPSGMTIDAASGRMVWNSAAGQGGGAVVVQVRDPSGAADVQAFEVGGGSQGQQQEYTGAPVDGFPNLFERRLLVYTNAVRMAPQEYRDEYMAGFQPSPKRILQANSPVEPLYYEPLLNASARSHATDMSQNGCFQHDSCDGTSWAERIGGFYPQARMIGENIAAGYSTAKSAVDVWLCDESGGQCAADGTSAAGHRTNIMNAGMRVAGAGYAADALGNRRHLWVQDLASNEPASKPPLVAGCHDFLLSGKTSFLLNYYDPTGLPPAFVQVVIDGVAHDMNLDLGDLAAGTYRVDMPKATSCREYYFAAETASGESWRYPGPGVFLTAGEGSCSADYR
jgi:hypothetical protein